MDVVDDTEYVDMLTTLSEGSVRRNFNPYTDIDWDSPEFAVIDNDERWILPATDPLGRHPWYQAQPMERQIEIGMWRQANVAKVGLQFESILIRGVMEYVFWTPNGSPGVPLLPPRGDRGVQPHHDVPGDGEPHRRRRARRCRGYFKWVQPLVPRGGRHVPADPVLLPASSPARSRSTTLQKDVLRDGEDDAPDHAAASCASTSRRRRGTSRSRTSTCASGCRTWRGPAGSGSRSYFPVTMRVLCDVIVIPPQEFWEEFDIPTSVASATSSGASPESRQMLRDYFGDVRALAERSG